MSLEIKRIAQILRADPRFSKGADKLEKIAIELETRKLIPSTIENIKVPKPHWIELKEITGAEKFQHIVELGENTGRLMKDISDETHAYDLFREGMSNDFYISLSRDDKALVRRSFNCIARAGYDTVGEIRTFFQMSEEERKTKPYIRDMGETSELFLSTVFGRSEEELK